MRRQKLEQILEQIAKANNTTPKEVRREMQLAMEAGLASNDPAIQARWAAIPRKGGRLTLEEFLEYLIQRL